MPCMNSFQQSLNYLYDLTDEEPEDPSEAERFSSLFEEWQVEPPPNLALNTLNFINRQLGIRPEEKHERLSQDA